MESCPGVKCIKMKIKRGLSLNADQSKHKLGNNRGQIMRKGSNRGQIGKTRLKSG